MSGIIYFKLNSGKSCSAEINNTPFIVVYYIGMSRRSIIKDTEEDMIKEAEVVMRWSGKRIVVATFLCLILIAGGSYGIYRLSQDTVRVLGTNTKNDHARIQIPQQKSVEQIIDNAKKDLSNINAKNIVESQPQLKKVIEDLTHLTGSSSSARNLICDTLCK